MSGTASDKPGAGAPNSAENSASQAGAANQPAATKTSSSPAGRAATTANPRIAQPFDPTAPATPQAAVKCPKCGASVREVARFCQRCHHTMRYECPSCHHQQRTGGTCEKCGIDFLKYIGAVMSQKQAQADVIHERFEQRSTFMKNLLWLPVTLGFPIVRDYFVKRERKK